MFTKKTVMKTAPLAAMALAALLAGACSDDDVVFGIPAMGTSTTAFDVDADGIADTEVNTAATVGMMPADLVAEIETAMRQAEGWGELPVAGDGSDCANTKSNWNTGATEFPGTIVVTETMLNADGTACNYDGTNGLQTGSWTTTTTGLGGITIAGFAPADLIDLPMSASESGFVLDVWSDGTDKVDIEDGISETATGTFNAAGDALTSGSLIGSEYFAVWDDTVVDFSRATSGVFLDGMQVNVSFTTDGSDVVTFNGTVKIIDDAGHFTYTFNDLEYDPAICITGEPTGGQLTIGNELGETVIDLPATNPVCGDADVTYMGDVAATADQTIW